MSRIKTIIVVLAASLFFAFPLWAGVTIVGGLSHERDVNPGETYRGVIMIKNTTDQIQEVKVYQTDYSFLADGTSSYGEAGRLERSNAKWISFSPARLAVAPQATAKVNYTVEVPAGKELKGTYWSMLMIEEIAKGSPESTGAKEKVALGIRQVMRYGIQIVTNMTTKGTTRIAFAQTRFLKEGKEKILQVDVENTGDAWARPLLWAEIFDHEGNYVGKFEGQRLRVYPGTSVRYRLNLSDLPDGEYKAMIVADCGGDSVFGATFTLKQEK
ncbi:MAG: hypothetical protein PHY31_07470 [Smithellaceae bacterium]|nr:hypothetical protein [Smithellaceae bacterium]